MDEADNEDAGREEMDRRTTGMEYRLTNMEKNMIRIQESIDLLVNRGVPSVVDRTNNRTTFASSMTGSHSETYTKYNLSTTTTEKPSSKRRKREPLKIGLLGCGAINSTVAKMITDGRAGPAVLRAVLTRTERSNEEIQSLLPKQDETSPNVLFTTNADKFFAQDWDLCVEAAGQPAVREHGKKCLELGKDLMITSIGSLTDDALYQDLTATAEASGARLILCTGSMPALDWMGSASLDDCSEVKVTQVKPPKAWLGTPAEQAHPDLLSLSESRVLFEGSSREAASNFPKNANVAAMLALATAGLDHTKASLVADPSAKGNRVELSFRGTAGKIQIQVEAAPSKTNPRTSAIVALSVVKAIRKLCCTVVVGL